MLRGVSNRAPKAGSPGADTALDPSGEWCGRTRVAVPCTQHPRARSISEPRTPLPSQAALRSRQLCAPSQKLKCDVGRRREEKESRKGGRETAGGLLCPKGSRRKDLGMGDGVWEAASATALGTAPARPGRGRKEGRPARGDLDRRGPCPRLRAPPAPCARPFASAERASTGRRRSGAPGPH